MRKPIYTLAQLRRANIKKVYAWQTHQGEDGWTEAFPLFVSRRHANSARPDITYISLHLGIGRVLVEIPVAGAARLLREIDRENKELAEMTERMYPGEAASFEMAMAEDMYWSQRKLRRCERKKWEQQFSNYR